MSEDKRSFRHELKYIVSDAQCALLKARLQPLMRPDPHAGGTGKYQVRSLYFDDAEHRCYDENLDGVDPREKFRLRIYDRSADSVRLECKRKERGMTCKESAPVSVDQAHALMEQQGLCMEEWMPLARRLILQGLKPAVIVEYTRFPFVYAAGNVRVTFDMGITSSSATADFFGERIPGRPVMPAGQHIMEVKFDAFLPDPLYHVMNLGTLQQTAFSKYCLCMRLSL